MPAQPLQVPLIKPDLPAFEEVEEQFREILANGRITNFGKYVREFEALAGEYLGAEVITVSSGTMGLVLTLQALGLRGGEKVVLPSFTFMASAQAVLHAGADPLFAEVEDDLTLSPADLELLLSEHADVGAVLPVHTYGLPARVDDIQRVVDAAAQRAGRPINVVYDAAHAFGSAVEGRRVGGFGDAEVFSLSVTKLLVSVEGGMISTRNHALADRLRKMRNYGIDNAYDAAFPGLNGKMSEFHAIVGLRNLAHLPQRLLVRAALAASYAGKVQARTSFQVFRGPPGIVHTYKDFTILLPDGWAPYRPGIIAYMADHGVETRAYFSPPVHQQAYFKRFADRPLPVTEDLSARVLTLPFFTTMTEPEIDYVVNLLADAEASLRSNGATM